MDNREKILTIAQSIIQRSGVDSFSFRTLAEEVNIKSSSVHYYFPKKEDLILEIAKKYRDAFFTALDTIQELKISPQSKIVELIKLFELTRSEGKMCFYGIMASSNEQLDQSCLDTSKQFFNLLKEWIKNIIIEAKKNNQLNSSVPPEKIAKLVVGLLEGCLMIDRINKNDEYLRSAKFLIKEMIK